MKLTRTKDELRKEYERCSRMYNNPKDWESWLIDQIERAEYYNDDASKLVEFLSAEAGRLAKKLREIEIKGNAEPKIKPLEWEEESSRDSFVAFGSFGAFEVYETGEEDGLKPWMGSLNDSNDYAGFESMDFDTPKEAMAYCNTLHEKQIREALKFVEEQK